MSFKVVNKVDRDFRWDNGSNPYGFNVPFPTTEDNGKVLSVVEGTYSLSEVETVSYTAGDNIQISDANVISATDTTYTAGTNVSISDSNVISATDTTYTAGDGINITENVISAKLGNGLEISNGSINITENNIISIKGNSYSTTPLKTGSVWIDNNDIFKLTINVGTLPNATTATVAHSISSIDKIIKWEAIAMSSTLYVDFVDMVNIDATNVNIDTGSVDMSGYTGYVTVYYTLKKSFDKVLFTTDYSSTADASQYQLYGGSGYHTRIWLSDPTNTVYIGLYQGTYGMRALAMTKDASVVVKNRYRRLGGGSQTGLSDLALSTAYSDKGYYGDITPPLSNNSFEGNRVGIEVVYNNTTELLSAFFD